MELYPDDCLLMPTLSIFIWSTVSEDMIRLIATECRMVLANTTIVFGCRRRRGARCSGAADR